MKKNSKNKKGMTLVEVIIAMALLSGMSAMLVTVAVAAKRQYERVEGKQVLFKRQNYK